MEKILRERGRILMLVADDGFWSEGLLEPLNPSEMGENGEGFWVLKG